MKFSYRSYQINPAPGFPEGIVWRPRIPLLVIGLTGELWLEALVDTGSDQTILPRVDVEGLGVRMHPDATSSVRGRLKEHEETLTMGEEIKLGLQLDNETYIWPATVWISSSADSPPILGHSGFLEYFEATFFGDKHELQLKPVKGFPGVATDIWKS